MASSSVQLYFVRHGDAGDKRKWKGPDAERPLSAKGLQACRLTADHFAKVIPGRPPVILTSPLVRAAQTAAIAARALGAEDSVVVDERLDHGFDPRRLRGILADYANQDTLVLVGHEPSMSRVIAVIVGCDGSGDIDLKKGGVAHVVLPDRGKLRGTLKFLVTPALLSCD